MSSELSSSPASCLQITSTVTAEGWVDLQLGEAAVVAPNGDEVVVRIKAVPINPSDLLVLFASADHNQARFEGSSDRPRVRAPLSAAAMRLHARRVGLPVSVGLEGAGVVVAAGANKSNLIGKKVALLTMTAGTFAQYRTVRAEECIVLPDDVAVEQGASLFVNPLTALAIAETARIEGYAGLIHTAAASNLGQMLVKICRADGLPLVNIVRKQEHVELLKSLGAEHVCNSSSPTFRDELMVAIEATGAAVAFDAIGGGSMAGEILAALEAVADKRSPAYNPYGSSERKHVYVYGHLDRTPTQLAHENYGLLWGVSSWLMPAILTRVGPERAGALHQRIVSELTTTFASRYTQKISLRDVLRRDVLEAYCRQATGEKYLIDPSL